MRRLIKAILLAATLLVSVCTAILTFLDSSVHQYGGAPV
jgi:hypothetical protein